MFWLYLCTIIENQLYVYVSQPAENVTVFFSLWDFQAHLLYWGHWFALQRCLSLLGRVLFFRNTKNHPLLQSKLSLNTILSVFERNEGTCGYKTLFNTKKSKFCKPQRKRMSIGSVRAFSPQRLAEILINHILTVCLVRCWPIGWFVFEFSGRV